MVDFLGYRPSAIAAAAILCAADEIADLPAGDNGDHSSRYQEWVSKVISAFLIAGFWLPPVKLPHFHPHLLPSLHVACFLYVYVQKENLPDFY